MGIALITGITGQDGSYLAEFLLEKGYEVLGLVRDVAQVRRDNLERVHDRVELIEGSLLDQDNLETVIRRHRPTEIYNLAARASSRTLVSDPVATAEVNGLAVARLLEAVRKVDAGIRVFQASSSEMFGRSAESPQNESTPCRPRNPYGVAKLFAHGMVAAFREHFGIFACSGILYNHESPRRTPDFVTRKISMAAAQAKAGELQSLQLGNLEAARDWGYAGDYVRGMWSMLQAAVPDDYVLATGRSHTVREFCKAAFEHLGLDYRNYVVAGAADFRPEEPLRLVGDASRARDRLGWTPAVSFEQLIGMMVDSDSMRLGQ